MSLILNQEAAASIPNPVAGKGTVFMNTSDQLSVKSNSGVVSTFPTIPGVGGNTQVLFNDAGSLNGNANLVFDKTTGITTGLRLNATANITAPQLISNVATGTAPLVVTSTTTVANLAVATATTAGTVTTAAQGNITSVGTLTSLGVTGNITAGNINTSGTETATRFISNIATGTAPLTVTSTTRVANLSVDYANVADFISVAAGTGNNFLIFANAATGNITELTSTGLIANLSNNSITATTFVGALSGAATSATTAGTVTTNAQPNITSTGTLTSLIVGNATANTTFGNGIFTATGNANVGNLGTAGLIVATGNVTGGNLTTGGIVSATGNITTGDNSNVISGRVRITSNAAGGYINQVDNSPLYLGANGFYPVTIASGTSNTTGNITIGSNLSVTSNGTFGNVNTSGAVTASTLVSNVVTGTAPLTVTSTTQVANLNVATAGVAGTVTTAAQGNITSVGTLTGLGVNGTITAVNITANTGVFTGNANGISSVQAGNIVGTTLGATVVTSSLTTVGTLGSLTVTGNVTGGNLVTGGVLTVNGTGVSSIAGNLDMTSNTIINLATPTNSTDAATKQYVDDVAQGLNIHDSCNAATTTTLATISGGTITYNNGTAGVGATLTTTGSYTTIDGVTLVNGMRILVKNEATTANNGIYVLTSSTVLTRAADFNTVPEVEAGDFTFVTAGTLYDNTGWVQVETVTTIGTSPIVFTQFSGAGTYTAGTGLTLTGTAFSVNVAQPTITSVGTLTSLGVSGAVTASTLVSNVATGTAPFTVTSTTQVANLSVATAGSATTAGTVTTAAQPNITSTGTLTSLTVTGNISGGNISTGGQLSVTGIGTIGGVVLPTWNLGGTDISTVGGGSAATGRTLLGWNRSSGGGEFSIITNRNGGGTGGVKFYEWANTLSNTTTEIFSVTAAGAVTTPSTIVATGNVTGGNITTAGRLVSSIATGTAPLTITSTTRVSNLNVDYANVADNINVAAGTGNNFLIFANAATGNVAELTSTGLTANLSNNSITATTFVGALSGAATSATTAGTVTTAAQPNITSVGTLTSLAVTGNISAGNVSATTFTGALSGAATTAGTVTTAAQGNITSLGTLTSLSVTGTVTAGTLSGSHTGSGAGLSSLTGANVTGTVASATNAGTVTTAAQPNITSVGTLTGLTLANASTITGNNITFTTGANTNAGTFTGNFSLSAGSRLNATYADLAEKYTADADYEPGTILVFGGNEEVTISTESDSFRVAGVVTTNPAYTMNNECEGEHVATIALQGRVPAKVIGPIFKGDLLVSTGNGYATANNIARAGTIIGKSLENFTGASGIIEVAVGRF